MTDTSPVVRTFASGATRDLDASKLDYEGFLSPYVLQAYADYMHGKRPMADGSLRDSDNWQKGMPLDSYMKSGYRHFMDWWANHRGNSHVAQEPLETALCALLFNVMGYLHETVKARVEGGPQPTTFEELVASLPPEFRRVAGEITPDPILPLVL